MIKITLFGPTGLIGNEILKLLENDSDFEKINVVSRKPEHRHLHRYVAARSAVTYPCYGCWTISCNTRLKIRAQFRNAMRKE